MREIDERIAAWREGLASGEAIDGKTARELESHLREAMDAELAAGVDADQAFETAVAQLGSCEALEAEFGKVYPAVSWSRRALLLAAGYGFASFAAQVFVWGHRFAETLSMLIFPHAVIKLPVPLNFERTESNIFEAHFPAGVHSITQVPLALPVSFLATLVVCLALIWFAARALREKSGWLAKVASNGKSLIVFASATCMVSMCLSSFWAFRPFSLGVGNLVREAVFAGCGLEPLSCRLAHFLFTGAAFKACWCMAFMFALCAFLRLRRRKISDYRAWVFAGPFAISGAAILIGLVGTGVGLLTSAFFPGLLEQSLPGQWWHPFHPQSMVALVTLACKLALFIVALIVVGVMLGRRRWKLAETLSGFVARFGLPLLLVWIGARLVLITEAVRVLPLDFLHRISAVSAPSASPMGAWITLLLVAIVFFHGRTRKGAEAIHA